jgi:lipopolysaccharide assembly outer membrane protein LptD (OstA)
MKLCLTLPLAAGLLGGALFVYAQAQAPAPRLHVDAFTSRGQGVVMAADSIERDESTIRLKGSVEIKLRPSNPDGDVMVLRADEAEYRKQGDEIVPRGNVRVTLEKI